MARGTTVGTTIFESAEQLAIIEGIQMKKERTPNGPQPRDSEPTVPVPHKLSGGWEIMKTSS